MGLQGRASLMKIDLAPGHPHLEHIEAIETYIQNAADLTKQLLGLARGGKYEVTPADLNEIVQGSASIFGRTKKEIKIHTNLQSAPLVAEVDRKQIAQVLLNVYINAWQAMPDGGQLFLETKTVFFEATASRPPRIQPGPYAQICVTDTGIGMDEATLKRIFDPFFTTKGINRGTGLGLASAYGIIHNHGGMITVYSEVGHGATFNIYLPMSHKEARREVHIENKLLRGTETVLIVDDEEMITDVGQAMLETLGYRVVVAGSGEQAVEALAGGNTPIDLVILDLIMPSMDGGQTFDEIRKIQPGMPVILSSGYALNGQADDIMRRGCNGFIQKPFNILELSQKVREILDSIR
jgi:CheY-like chemotaxis protein